MSSGTCSVDGCDNAGKITRRMCAKHYRTWLNNTQPEDRGLPPRADRRFDDYLEPGENGCILWTGASIRGGYGFWACAPERGLAHRISLDRVVPCPDPALFACHKCDNPPCVNPEHLYWGTVQDNGRDVRERGGQWNKGRYQTHCKNGHEIAGDNIRIAGPNGLRRCRTCDNARKLKSYHKTREARRVELG